MQKIALKIFLSMTSVLLASLSAILMPGCGSNEPIVIGFIAGTTGRVADLGISGRDAVQMYIEEINSQGGINGRNIRLVVKNDAQDPETAIKGVKELIDIKASVIIGPMTSSMAMAVIPVANEAKVPLISPTVSTDLLSGKDDYFFRISPTTRKNTINSAAYGIKTANMKRMCAIYDENNPFFCKNWLDNFSGYFTSHGGEIIFTIGFDTSKTLSFSQLANQVLGYRPDGILIIANSMDSATLCQQIRKMNKETGIILSDWGGTERLLELGGKAVEGVVVAQAFNRDDKTPAYQDFRKKYFNRFKKEPGFPGVFAWDAAGIAIAALERRNKNENLKATLLGMGKFKGLQKEFCFDKFGDVVRDNSAITIIKDTKFAMTTNNGWIQ